MEAARREPSGEGSGYLEAARREPSGEGSGYLKAVRREPSGEGSGYLEAARREPSGEDPGIWKRYGASRPVRSKIMPNPFTSTHALRILLIITGGLAPYRF